MKNAILILFLLVANLMSISQTTSMIWEDQGIADETPITSPTVFSEPDGCITITLTWDTVTVGSGTVMIPSDTNGFLFYESGGLGAHYGYCQFGFDNSDNDPNDKLHIQLTFSEPVENLTFSLLDIDGITGSFDDGIELYYNGINVKPTGFYTIVGTVVVLDNETYMEGFEGNGTGAPSTTTDGNVDFNFGATSISTIDIYYFSTDDAGSNPGGQLAGISDISFDKSASAPCSVPTELLDFIAEPITGGKMQLKWITASETNNDFFTIEKSNNGINWNLCKIVDGAGYSSTLITYSELDTEPFKGTSYYRLKQTDFDGDYSYSSVVAVKLDEQTPHAIDVYPNPTSNYITIEGDPMQLNLIRVYNHLGTNVITKTKTSSKNESLRIIDLSDLPAGIYYIKTPLTSESVLKL